MRAKRGLGALGVCGGFAVCAALSGCGGASGLREVELGDAGTTADVTPLPDVTGHYTGTADSVSTPTNPPGPPQTGTTMLEIDVSNGPGAGQLTLTIVGAGGQSCALTANRAASTASLPAGESCSTSSSGTTSTVTVVQGAAMFSGNTLSFRLQSMVSAVGPAGVSFAATGTITFTGTRP